MELEEFVGVSSFGPRSPEAKVRQMQAYHASYVYNPQRGTPPVNFEDMLQRYPTLVYNIVRRMLRYSVGLERAVKEDNAQSVFEADLEEHVQDVYLHLMSLHPDSIYRAQGFTDKIQVYDPSLCPSNLTPAKHFTMYLNEIVRRFMLTKLYKRRKDALYYEHEHYQWEDVTVVVNPEPRMNRNILLRECVDYISEATATGDLKGSHWKTLATKLGVTDAGAVRPRVLHYLKVNTDTHIQC